MAKGKSAAKTTAAKKKQEKEQEKETVVEKTAEEKTKEVEEVEEKPKRKVREKLDEHMLVPIASGTKGGLTYISARTGDVWKFSDYGDQDVMELKEIRTMRSSARKFLTRGWIRILDDEVIEYLNLQKLQQENVEEEDLEDLLTMTPDQITELINKSNSNAKRLIYGFAKDKFVNGKLTNIHTIEAIEEGLGESLNPNA